MTYKVFLPLMICMLTLVGCYRPAGEEFEQVDSQSVESLVTPTIDLSVLTPTTDATDDTAAQAVETESTTDTGDVQPTKTEDPADVNPTGVSTIEPTSVIPATNPPAVVPTATNPVFLTPEPAPGQVEQPTIIPPTATATQDIIPPTATEFGAPPDEPSECVYEVASGDNLFRIAIDNGTTVEAIQQLNSLEGDAIQVGQFLTIPGCVPGQTQADDDEDTTTDLIPTATSLAGGSSIATVEPLDNVPIAGQQIHVVVSGETLGSIANRYNTSINAIVDLNGLDNPNSLSIGQELLIPASN